LSPPGVGCLTVLTLKPLARRAARADFTSIPTTSGTCTCSGPFDTVIVTCEPFGTLVFATGLCDTTSFFGALSEKAWSTLTLKPETDGTSTSGGPPDTARAIVLPSATRSPAGGSCAATVPGFCSEATRCVLTSKPSLRSRSAACFELWPTTFGTVRLLEEVLF